MNYYPINPEFLAKNSQLKTDYKNIVSNELKFKISRDFFLYQDHYYPIKIKFTLDQELSKKVIGSFNSNNLTITINYNYYQYMNPEDQLNILRHEIAHYLDYIQRGNHGADHDAHFHKLCLSYGWGSNVYQATFNSDIEVKIHNQFKIQQRTIKLLNLAKNNSSWEEAQSALLKAQSLIHDYNINIHESDNQQTVYIAIELASGRRLTQKYQTIAQLLESFSCKCIVLTTPGHFTLEAICLHSNKDAIYELYLYLEKEIDQWYLESKKNNPKLHRTSFYQGLNKGLQEKLHQQKKQLFSFQNALMTSQEKSLLMHFKMLYPKTSQTGQKTKHDLWSYLQGQIVGKRLELKNKLNQSLKFLN